MVSIGEMRSVIKFEKNQPVNTPGGPGFTDSFTEFLTARGCLKKNNGNRVLSTGEIVEDNRFTLTVWFQAALFNELFSASVKSLKVIVSNRKFTIASWTELIEDNQRQIEFKLNEQR